ncbi:mRNA surveillance protein pelota [Candidatus Woesearchaeota archaeon]|nr:mRNA surveillance protein pelota [Candidatus Woesearchaeota archaeon]
MKILKKDLKRGKIVVQAQSLDDLWLLNQTVVKGDTVTGRTTRKVRLGSSEEAVKKQYVLSVAVEGVEFKDQALRLSGKTTELKEDVPKGAHHTIAVEPGEALTIIKERWQKYQLDRLSQATQQQLKVLIVVFDRESCLLARLKARGYDVIAELKGKVRKKDYSTATVTNFYREIIAAVKDYDDRSKPDKIVLASPAFWKEELMNELNSDVKAAALKGKVIMSACSSVSENAIDEVLKRPEMETVLATAMAAKETKLVDEAMAEIAKDGKAAYGAKEVEQAVEAAAVEKLLITDVKVYNNPDSELLMKAVEDKGGRVFIINSENAAGQKLDALGGMAAILRYKVY